MSDPSAPLPADAFTPRSLRTALGDRPFRFYPQVTSTQDVARDWISDQPDLPPGALVITEEQTAGRGRQGRRWIAPSGTAILVSMILQPRVTPEQLPRVTMLAALAVYDALSPLAPDAIALKWPNDVLLDGRKVCGILSEATWHGPHLGPVVAGIGINVRVPFTETILADYATSLEAATGAAIDRHALLANLARRLDAWAGRIHSPDLLSTWRHRLVTLGQRVTVYPQIDGSDPFDGIAEDVGPNGALLVRRDSGKLERLLAADVGLAHTGPPPDLPHIPPAT